MFTHRAIRMVHFINDPFIKLTLNSNLLIKEMDIIFNNLDLMKIFTISLIKLDVDKDLILKMMYHMYNVHQSNKCMITNLLFPKSKETCDEIIRELEDEEDQEIIQFLSTLKNKIKNEPFERDIDAVSVASKTFVEINQHCKVHQQIGNQKETYLRQEEFNRCLFKNY